MQDILVYVRELQERTPAEYYGARMAAARAGRMTGLYVCASSTYMAPDFTAEVVEAVAENARKVVEDAIRAKQPFLAWANSMGITEAAWIVAEGSPLEALAGASAAHDLLVLDRQKDAKGLPYDIPAIVLKTRGPCLVLPAHGVRYVSLERFAIAWNGTFEAMRAMRAALPWMRGKQALLMRGEERQRFADLVWYPEFDVEAYLRVHGVDVSTRDIVARHDDVGAALLEEASCFRADLLVMGAYGRPRFSEWMLGGATRDVLTWADLPVLLQH